MAKKSEVVSAINSFANARATGDQSLIQFSAQLVAKYVDELQFDPEDNEGVSPSDNGAVAPVPAAAE